MNDLKRAIRLEAFKKGAFLGLAILATGISSFYFITGIVSSQIWILIAPIIFSVIIPLGLVVAFCFALRKSVGGYWDFRQAVSGIFIMFLMALIVQTLGRDLVFVKLVEPHMLEKTRDAMLKSTTTMLENTGAPKAQVEAKKADIIKQFDDQKIITPATVTQGIAFSVIFIFILSLIFAALFKREAPFKINRENVEYTDSLS